MDKQKQIINFLKYLSLHGVSPKSLKYYKSDFISFLNWAGNKKINQSLILEYINSIRAVTPISTLKRRQSTLRSYASFMGFKKVSNTWQESILYAFTKKPRLQNFFHKLFFSRPNWYRTYHSYQLATYIHVAILVLFTSIAGFAVYDQIFNTKNNLLAFPTALTRPNRYLSFQGRLTSNVGNPITTATNLVFKLYDASTAGTELWTSGTCSITPDQDGIFSTLLGTTTNCPTATEIAATVFSENASVWVGVTVAADAEATPRVQIATVAYALNSETLQGYPAGTGTSTIPYIASTGTLVLANASPKIQSTSGTFAVEGLAMTITTPNASNGVITVNPDGVGTLNLTFEGAAAGLSANGFVNATNANITSGALYGGTVASAATGYNFIDFQSGVSPTSKFSVQDDGDIITAGDLTLSGGNLNTGNIALTIGDATTDTITLTTDGTGNGEVVLPNDSIGPNEILSTGQTDEYCLTYEGTGTTWEWQSCAAAGGGSWSALTVPTANLSLAHAGYTTAFTFDSVTTADAFALSSSSLTTGTVLDLSSTSTAGGASGLSKVLDIARSGTNTNASHTAYGLYSAVTNTGTTSTNVGGYFSASGATNNYGLIVGAGNVGIGTTGPDAKLDSLATTEQLRLTYTDGSVYSSFTTDSNGYIAIDPTGARISLDGSLQIGGTTPLAYSRFGTGATDHSGNLTASNDLLISSDLELDGNLYLDGGTIANSAGTASIILSSAPTTTANTLSAGNWLIENTANVGQSALIINQQKAGELLTASASGVTKFIIANTAAITSAIGNWTSQVADSSTAIGFTFNTSNTLSTQGSKLLSFQNLGTEKMYLDKDGNLYVSGTVLSGNGTSMLLTNKSGATVATRSVVVLDTSNNTSFTTTTTPYSKSGFGVVIGAGLGVTNDADGDGVCDANDICMIAYGGSVNVTVKNATTAVKGDYLFTSDTAGSAVASAKQYDGLVGIVDDTTNAASGYLKMIFKVQPQVTAAAAIDKTTKHNEYWLYADQYQAVGEGSNTDTNLLQRGLSFDTFSDSTKIDSANTTASFDTNTQKTGLIGGQTMSTATTDNDGQTYLGSNTVNDTYFYDRTRDSSPQVQVELGIDPNWYNGVTLSVATTSATFSQNSVIASGAKQSNPNLSTSYNGSLIKATGTDATPRTIYITIKSPTTFDWTNYQGDSATGVTITAGTAQTLGDTGVSVTFTNARYNTGDVFKIASWFIEAESSTRGAKQQFPEKSTVIATASSVDIIDADTQKLWMRFSQGTSYAIGVDANNDPSSANMLNGKAYISTNGSSATGLYTLDFAHDAAFKQNATDYRLSDTALTGRNGTNTYNVINTSNILVNITANDVSAAVIPNQPTQEVTVSGWGYLVGDNVNSYARETVNLPYKFNLPPSIIVAETGYNSTTTPTSLSSCSGIVGGSSQDAATASYVSNSSFWVNISGPSAFSSTVYRCYTWTATGQVSPRQYVAVATGTGTSGGTTIINETDQSSVNILISAAGGNIQTNVALTNKGDLYSVDAYTPATPQQFISVYHNTASLTSNEGSWAQYRSGFIPVASQSIGGWTSVVVSGTAGSATTVKSLSVTSGTSTIDGKSNTLYVGTDTGLSIIQEKQSGSYSPGDGSDENNGSVKYYTKDYISEEMVGNVQGMWGFNSALTDSSVKAATITASGATITYPTGVRNKGINITVANGTATTTTIAATYSMGIWVKETAGWTHYVKTNEGTYINGVLSSTAFTNRMTWVTTTVTLVAGTQDVDEMFATNTTMTPGQVKNMYQVGYRALQSHATTLGGGAADTNQQLGFISTGTNVIGDAKPDYNNQFMYVGTNSTTLGAVSKIDLNSDTNIKTYNSSANVPTGGPLLIDEDTKSLAVGYNLEAVGSATTGVKTMGVDNNATATSGNFIGKTITTAESFTQAYLWAQYTLDASDASNTIQVWASNDGGSNYSQCNLTNTDTSRSPSEYEYFCQFNTPGSSLKTKFVMARGSTKTNTWVSKYGIAWIDSNAVAGSANGSGLFTNTNASVANGSYIDVAHNQNSNDVVTNGWVYNTNTAKWEPVDNSVVAATGGTITTSGAYTIHTFTGSGTFTPSVSGDVEYLVIAGGGGGGSHSTRGGGGGGAGGYRSSVSGESSGGGASAETPLTLIGGTGYTVTVGAGGAGSTAGNLATNGSNSVFSTITATGGGGAHATYNGAAGGSGGGGGYIAGTGGAGTSNQGYAGGTSPASLGTLSDSGSGGGGAGGVGANGTTSGSGSGGAGGAGISSSITGSAVTRAGGGGGGNGNGLGGSASGGGGTGGGTGADGTANTGGGGGGRNNGSAGGTGGSGIVIVRYLTNSLSAFKITQQDANTVRLYNYSGATQNLRLDVITGGLGRNAGTVSLAPAAADVDSAASTNSIWINKTGSGGNLLKLQSSGTDVLSLATAGTMTLAGNFLPATDNTYALGSTSNRWKDLFLGPTSLHVSSTTGTSGVGANYVDGTLGYSSNALTLATAVTGTVSGGGSINLTSGLALGNTTTSAFNLTTSADFGATDEVLQIGDSAANFMTVLGNGNVGIGTTAPGELLDIAATTDAAGVAGPKIRFTKGATNKGVIGIGGNYLGVATNTDDMVFRNDAGDMLFGFSGAEKVRFTSAGNVGIGTTSPGFKLVAGGNSSANVPATSGSTDSSQIARIYATNVGGGGVGLDFGVGNLNGSSWIQARSGDNFATNYSLLLNPNGGNVGIGTTGPGYLLTVNSSTPGCNGCTAWTNYSDSRLKENIVNLSGDILDKIMDLKPVTFNYNDAYYSQTGYTQPDGQRPTFTGFIAQDLQQIFPEMVSTAGSGYLDTNLSNLQIYLVKGIQQQQREIASISGQLASLLQIDGSCVTGDTMLPIRRKKKRRNSDDEQDEFDEFLCRIDDILPGDEVLSLNEFTGALEYARINKLKDMDIKEVYELTTKSGKVIRTTANHPYLTLSENNPIANEEKINI